MTAAIDAYIAGFRVVARMGAAAVRADCGLSAGNSHSTGFAGSAVDAAAGIESSVTNDESAGVAAPLDAVRVSRVRLSRRFMTESDLLRY